ncbi:hypothetical protein JDN40_12905 [Rhodomicrobium vannielii ATCC 17100]|uniref:AsmA family protein n=1 Tax=Rhodomicrobium vannielii TaxID=1069 RepID=UPI001917B52A|nr:hypothetical protein [Rhodomicrobium vannielii]MBJ7535007.1 hypothetical protein [Rhodomicrobium vannielii ATCC 17100]
MCYGASSFSVAVFLTCFKMYQITRKVRYVLKVLAAAGLCAGLALVLFAVALPRFLDGDVARKSFVKALSAWSGGKVTLAGQLRIASFATLSVEASNVRFHDAPGLDPVQRGSAETVTAVVNLSSLLLGNLEYRKFVVSSPRFVLQRDAGGRAADELAAARLALTLVDRSSLPDIQLRNPVFYIADGALRPYRRVTFERIALKRPDRAAAAPFALSMRKPGFELAFKGERNGQKVSGQLKLVAAGDHPLAAHLIAALTPWETASGFSLEGDLTWSRERFSLDNASLSFGDRTATGVLALDVSVDPARLEGTLAYDTLDVTPMWAAARGTSNGGEASGSPGGGSPPARVGRRDVDLDIRLSADRLRAGAFEAGPVALAVSARSGHLSIDVAELALFGGNAIARVEIDPARPSAMWVTGTAKRLDAGALASALQLPLSVRGPATVRLGLNVPLGAEAAQAETGTASGRFALLFPLGGSLDGVAGRTLGAAVAGSDVPAGGRERFPFAAARIDGTLTGNGVDLDVQGQHEGQKIEGKLRIALPDAAVSGTLSTRREEAPVATSGGASKGGVASGSATARSSKLVLSGTAAAPVLSSHEASLSN